MDDSTSLVAFFQTRVVFARKKHSHTEISKELIIILIYANSCNKMFLMNIKHETKSMPYAGRHLLRCRAAPWRCEDAALLQVREISFVYFQELNTLNKEFRFLFVQPSFYSTDTSKTASVRAKKNVLIP